MWRSGWEYLRFATSRCAKKKGSAGDTTAGVDRCASAGFCCRVATGGALVCMMMSAAAGRVNVGT